MEIKLLEDEFSVCKIRDLSGVNLTDAFILSEKPDEELSLVCRTEHVPEETTDREDGWKAFRNRGSAGFFADRKFGGNIGGSGGVLDRYFRCFYVQYGLRSDEERRFYAGGAGALGEGICGEIENATVQ